MTYSIHKRKAEDHDTCILFHELYQCPPIYKIGGQRGEEPLTEGIRFVLALNFKQ